MYLLKIDIIFLMIFMLLLDFLFKDCLHCEYYDIMLWNTFHDGYCILKKCNVKNNNCCENYIHRKYGDGYG